MGEEVKAGCEAADQVRENGPAGDGSAGQPVKESEPVGLAGENVEEDPVFALHARLAEEKAKADDYYNRLARLQADFENFRRRTRQEKEEFTRYAAEQLVTALLPVLDNFERALAAGGDSVEDLK
ncbi:MAG: nucleotide exchange factor GrpE, partial [Peptococcaceae bacterium]|nr:nucleotide exchange factor GrpE [Peptococcaceae bacterium]